LKREEVKKMRKNKTISLLLLSLALLSTPVTAHGAGEGVIHTVQIIFVMATVAMVFMAAGMFAKELGKAFKVFAVGLALAGIEIIFEILEGFGINPLGVMGATEHLANHLIAVVGFGLMCYGAYKIYAVAKGVAAEK